MSDLNFTNSNFAGVNLSCSNFEGADFTMANLRGTDLSHCKLEGANFYMAHLDGATFYDSDIRKANFIYAFLIGSNLRFVKAREAIFDESTLTGARLSNSDFSKVDFGGASILGTTFCSSNLTCASFVDAKIAGADFNGANLMNANFDGAKIDRVHFSTDISVARNLPFIPPVCPESGSFIAWKVGLTKGYDSCITNPLDYDHVVIKLEIPEDAKRSSGDGRKCRCSKAKVLEIRSITEPDKTYESAVSVYYDVKITYKVGETVTPDAYDENRWNVCSNGIHFFMSREEAIMYARPKTSRR